MGKDPNSSAEASTKYEINLKSSPKLKTRVAAEGTNIIDDLVELSLREFQHGLGIDDEEREHIEEELQDLLGSNKDKQKKNREKIDDEIEFEDGGDVATGKYSKNDPKSVFKKDVKKVPVITFVRKRDNGQNAYFYEHHLTKKLTWDIPTEGVVHCFDSSGKSFYINAATRKSAWNLFDLEI